MKAHAVPASRAQPRASRKCGAPRRRRRPARCRESDPSRAGLSITTPVPFSASCRQAMISRGASRGRARAGRFDRPPVPRASQSWRKSSRAPRFAGRRRRGSARRRIPSARPRPFHEPAPEMLGRRRLHQPVAAIANEERFAQRPGQQHPDRPDVARNRRARRPRAASHNRATAELRSSQKGTAGLRRRSAP